MFNPTNLFRGMNPMALLSQLQGNPMAMLSQAGFRVPQNINSPKAIVEYLTQSGQLSQAQLNQAQQMAQMFGVK